MNYKDYSPEDFAADAYFRKWVQSPDVHTDLFWETYLAQNPGKREVVREAKKLVLSIRFQENEYSDAFVEKIWHNIDKSISDQEKIRPLHSAKPQSSTKFLPQYRKMAAVLLMLLTTAAVFIVLYFSSTETHATAFGETKVIVLPDSSVVTLNANSKISYHSQWESQEEREVWLEGEAFFDVRKKPALLHSLPGVKFIVHVNLMDVEVLGTQFTVNTRRGKTQVVLSSGKVKLNSEQAGKQSSIEMQPGEMVELSEKTKVFTKKVVNPNLYSSWVTKELIFDKTPIAEIVKILEDNYGWEVEVKNQELLDMTFTATVPNKKPDVLLALLAESFNVKITRKGEKITIYKINHNLEKFLHERQVGKDNHL